MVVRTPCAAASASVSFLCAAISWFRSRKELETVYARNLSVCRSPAAVTDTTPLAASAAAPGHALGGARACANARAPHGMQDDHVACSMP
eukprot:2589683-Rhodomonas_salina.2